MKEQHLRLVRQRLKDNNMNEIRRLLKDHKGSVTIEFFFATMFMLIIFAFMVELVLLRSTMGKLDRTSYSLVNILRERTQFYNGDTNITERDAEQFRILAARLLDRKSGEVKVRLERWGEETNGVSVRGDQDCQPITALEKMSSLSPRSETIMNASNTEKRRVPLYQVTLCVENSSLFADMVLGKEHKIDKFVRSSSMAVSR